MKIFGFKVGLRRDADARIQKAEEDLHAARVHAKKAKQVIDDLDTSRGENHWASIIKQSLLDGHNGG